HHSTFQSVAGTGRREPLETGCRGRLRPPSRPLLDAFQIRKSEEKEGGTQTREHRSPDSNQVRTARHACWRSAESPWRVLELAVDVELRAMPPGGALCRPRSCRCPCQRHCRRQAGRERPPFPSPLLRPRVQLEGSLTPRCPCHVRPDEQRVSLAAVE